MKPQKCENNTLTYRKLKFGFSALPKEHDGLSEISFPRGKDFNLHQASTSDSVKYHKASKPPGAEPGPRLTPIGLRKKEGDN